MEVDYSGQSNRYRGQDAERRPTNTGLITQFRRVSQMVQNNVAADKSRKTSRITKGLNPDVPRPVNQSPSKLKIIFQLYQKILRKQKKKKLEIRLLNFKRWTNIKFLLNSYVTDLELTYKVDLALNKQLKEMLNKVTTNYQKRKNNQLG